MTKSHDLQASRERLLAVAIGYLEAKLREVDLLGQTLADPSDRTSVSPESTAEVFRVDLQRVLHGLDAMAPKASASMREVLDQHFRACHLPEWQAL